VCVVVLGFISFLTKTSH